jgi:hypothetical protein
MARIYVGTYAKYIMIFMVFMAIGPRPAKAQDAGWRKDGTWQMQNYGRNHGILSGPGMPKCNVNVSEECRRLYPQLLKIVPKPDRG